MDMSDHQSPPADNYHSSVLTSMGHQPKPEGVDYSLQRQHEMYASMMQRTGVGHTSDRRSSQPYVTGYEQTTGHYGSNSTPVTGSSGSLKSGMNPIGSAGSPTQSTWTPRHLQRVGFLVI